MQRPRPTAHGDRLGQEDDDVRAAIRFAILAAAGGLLFLLVAVLWVSTCGDAGDTVACGTPQRTLLGLGAPVILLGCGLRAFLRTYQVWRGHGTWWGWQGAGWFLMMLMLLTLTMGAPPIIGAVPGG